LDIFKDKKIIAPLFQREEQSLSLARVLDYGREFNADLVINVQLFSFAATRAASIPPRAGMFVKMYSVQNEKTVFVGEDYQAAGGPGGSGGREMQAQLVAKAILQQYAKEVTESGSARQGIIQLAKSPSENVPKLLVLPYYELPNPSNFVAGHGGGGVVTGLYQMALACTGKVEILEAPGLYSTHGSIISPEEALALGRELGADFVLRGQVTEFNRAKSVPSMWSAVISVTVLGAQVLFAEVSGVDIATEIYRVSDNTCVYARRDISHQKYVVRAEKTVRNLAALTAPEVVEILENPPEFAIQSLIDSIVLPDLQPQLAADQPTELEEADSITPPSETTAEAETEEVEVVSLSVEE
ncbi:MAG: hypothetical protein JXA52_06505, partial [Planctomycetes bacterium]|nr:hypothetical protein [Planctomycetota bacterium]